MVLIKLNEPTSKRSHPALNAKIIAVVTNEKPFQAEKTIEDGIVTYAKLEDGSYIILRIGDRVIGEVVTAEIEEGAAMVEQPVDDIEDEEEEAPKPRRFWE